MTSSIGSSVGASAVIILLIKGILVGIACAAPVGPVALLCVRRTLLQGRPAGFASGMGAVLADLIYGALATFSVAAVSDLLLQYEETFRLVGGVFLIILGLQTYLKPPPKHARPIVGRLFRAFFSAFLLTITNPLTILGFTAVLAGFGVVSDGMTTLASWLLVTGICIGAAAWWCGLTMMTGMVRGRISIERLAVLNHVSGAMIILFGVASIGSLFLDL